ncbi:MAG: 50S ribosomal protein L1 [Candidatus Aenigmarchaeota archaeon]|nr:50S ribosomal protein L1 [Candidatus Aenigmarchaeota archaeon]
MTDEKKKNKKKNEKKKNEKKKKEKKEKPISKQKTTVKKEEPKKQNPPKKAVKPKPEKKEAPLKEAQTGVFKTKTFEEAIKSAREASKKRKFNQTWDLIVNLKNINLKKEVENRFNLDHLLPEGRGEGLKVAVIADSLASKAGKCADLVVRKQEIPSISKDKKKLKNIAESYDFFYAEATLMIDVAKNFGAILGPRGKMAKPIPPNVDVEPFVKRAKRLTKLKLSEIPVVYVAIGKEDMADEKIAKNVESVYGVITEKMPKGKENIKSVYLKLTMGKPIRVI